MSGVPHRASEMHTVALHHRLQQNRRSARAGHREAGPRVVKVPTQHHHHHHHRAGPSHALIENSIGYVVAEEADDTSEESTALPAPSTMVVSGQDDPFSARNIDSDLSPTLISRLLDQARNELTLLTPRGAQSSALPESVMRLATGEKALIYSLLVASLAHTRARAGVTDRSALEDLCATRAVQALNNQISGPREAATAANIWAVIGLAIFGKFETVRPGKLPRQSPVKEWQPLRIHGSLMVNLKYYRGFMKLVLMAGGLQAIKDPGFGESLAYLTLCASTVILQRHRLPFIGHSGEYLDSRGRLLRSENERMHIEPTLERLGSCFREVWTDEPGRPITDLLRVVAHMSDFVAILESYLDGRSTGRSPATLMDQTNFTHHMLMSLPPAKEFAKATGTLSDELYEPCRLGCIVFSLLVIFPLPPTMPLCSRITATLLRHLARVEHATTRDTASSRLVVWVLTMGAVFAIGLPERRAFLILLTKLLDHLTIDDLTSFRQLLVGFLWHPRTNDIDGIGVWRDVRLLRQRNASKDDHTVQIAERAALPD